MVISCNNFVETEYSLNRHLQNNKACFMSLSKRLRIQMLQYRCFRKQSKTFCNHEDSSPTIFTKFNSYISSVSVSSWMKLKTLVFRKLKCFIVLTRFKYVLQLISPINWYILLCQVSFKNFFFKIVRNKIAEVLEELEVLEVSHTTCEKYLSISVILCKNTGHQPVSLPKMSLFHSFFSRILVSP